MNQRKIVLLSLTLLVSACMYVSFTLSKKLQAVIKRVLTLESNINAIQDKTNSVPTMNIMDSKTPTLTAYVNDESVSDVDYEVSSDDEADIQQVSNALLSGVSNSLEGTNHAISSMNAQLLELQNHIGQTKQTAGLSQEVSEADDDTPAWIRNGDKNVTLTTQRKNDRHITEDAEDAEDIGSDEEVEYVIEYETASEDEDNEEVVEEDGDTAVENIEQFACAMSQKHTKNTLIGILKEHDLSTYGNKDTLIKRIMTIDNFQQYLSTA